MESRRTLLHPYLLSRDRNRIAPWLVHLSIFMNQKKIHMMFLRVFSKMSLVQLEIPHSLLLAASTTRFPYAKIIPQMEGSI